MAIGDPKPTEQINRLGKRGFTTFNAQKTEGICAYCLGPFQRGQWTAWAPGIVKGHSHCIEAAWQALRLIIGPSGAHNRAGCMLAHCRPADESWEALRAVGAIVGPVECLVDQRLDRECFGRYNIVAARCDGCDSRLRCRHFAAELSALSSGPGRWSRACDELKEIAQKHAVSIVTAKQPRREVGLEELYAPAGSRPVMDCFGRHALLDEKCEKCGYRKNCEKETRDEKRKVVENCLDGHGQLDCGNCWAYDACCFGRAWESPDETCDDCLVNDECKQAWDEHQQKPFNEWRKPHCNMDGLQCHGDPGTGDVCSERGCHYDGHNSKEESLEGQTITTKGPIKGIPSCEHFPPQRIAVLVMHERMRPSMGVVKEMDKEEFKWLLEEQWAQMALEKLDEWKRENGRNLPFCPEHIDLKGRMVKIENRAWLRELWLVCPGTGIKRGV